MTATLKTLMLATDVGFLVYWSVTALAAVGALAIPPEWLFSGYHDPVVVAWNWSFLPLDLALSACGLTSVALQSRGDPRAAGLALISLSLTFCAGLMAIAFWTIRLDFSALWWAFNLFLMVWPLPYLRAALAYSRPASTPTKS